MWEVIQLDYEIHIYPLQDYGVHILSAVYMCSCHPEVSHYGMDTVVCHNSFDGRELFEERELGEMV